MHTTLESGDVRAIAPGHADWDAARAAWNLLADQRPALIVRAAKATDVAAAVRHARARGLRVAAQNTGHGAAALGPLNGTVLIRTAQMNDVSIFPERRTVRVGAGALWSDVISAAAPHGLAAPHGFSAGIGVAGYVLGGGLGWLARRYGLASDHVRSFDVVTAEGERRRVDATHEPELFWALRGGGGGGAIVTSVELALLPLREAYAGALLWPIERAGEVAHAYREWIAGLPDTLTSSLRLMSFPPLPGLPAALRGRRLVQLTGAFLGSRAEGDALLAPLRALAPEIDTVGMLGAASLATIAGDPVDPLPARDHSRLLATVDAAAVETLISLADPAVNMIELRQLGGALRCSTGAAGAIEAEALVFASGVPASEGAALTLARTFAALDTLGVGTDRDTLLSFAGRADAGLPVASRDRVRSIAAAYDPAGLFVSPPGLAAAR